MQVHTFRGPGRIFGFTTDETGANLPEKYAPWTPFSSVIDMHRDAAPTPGSTLTIVCPTSRLKGFHLTDGHIRISES